MQLVQCPLGIGRFPLILGWRHVVIRPCRRAGRWFCCAKVDGGRDRAWWNTPPVLPSMGWQLAPVVVVLRHPVVVGLHVSILVLRCGVRRPVHVPHLLVRRTLRCGPACGRHVAIDGGAGSVGNDWFSIIIAVVGVAGWRLCWSAGDTNDALDGVSQCAPAAYRMLPGYAEAAAPLAFALVTCLGHGMFIYLRLPHPCTPALAGSG